MQSLLHNQQKSLLMQPQSDSNTPQQPDWTDHD
jgi:hypothetical protein